MIQIAVTLLVALQAIVPPGACLCQFLPCEINTRPAKEAAPELPTPLIASAAEPCCSCSARRYPANTSTPSPGDGQAATGRPAPPEHSCPSPAPPPPCSGCPVLSVGPEARLAILPAPEEVLPATDIYFVVRTGESTRYPAARHEPIIIKSNTPLFLRHCAFLI